MQNCGKWTVAYGSASLCANLCAISWAISYVSQRIMPYVVYNYFWMYIFMSFPPKLPKDRRVCEGFEKEREKWICQWRATTNVLILISNSRYLTYLYDLCRRDMFFFALENDE